jgi:ankyrin repeat protein
LRVEELAEVLAIDFDTSSNRGIPQLHPSLRWDDQHQAVLSTCSSLITIVEYEEANNSWTQVVQFSHFSVKEFLTSNRLASLSENLSFYHIALEPAHTILALACSGVLLRLDDRVNEDNVGDMPLVKYAFRHWFDHARFGNVSSHIRDVMEYFFDADKQHWTAWCRLQTMEVSWPRFSHHESLDAFPLYFAALGGFYDLVEHLLGKNPEHINVKGGRMMTPLVAALGGKHFQVAELLYQNGANVDVRDRSGDTPLREACKAGFLDIVQLLINHGADVNAHGYAGLTPLHTAAIYGHLPTVRLLVEHNADIHIRTKRGKTPLHVVTGSHPKPNHIDIMRVLLKHGADPNARDYGGSTPLHRSPWFGGGYRRRVGTAEGTRLLLEHGAIIDAKNGHGKTPLDLALEEERHQIVECLKKYGATVHGDMEHSQAVGRTRKKISRVSNLSP